MRIPLLLLLVPSLATADKLTAHVSDGTNLHMAGNRGAMHWTTDIAITLDLAAGNKLTLSSTGSRKEHVLDGGASSRNEDDESTWTTKWTGTYAKSADKLTIDLVLGSHTCKHEKKTTEYDSKQNAWVNYTPQVLPCQVAAKQTKLTCKTDQVQVAAGTQTQPVTAWSCTAASSGDLAETPTFLVFGKTGCIDMFAGRMSAISYGLCPGGPGKP